MPKGMNDTNVKLIPKVNHPEKVQQFRSISLCNVSYTITKLMTNIFQCFMHEVIEPQQSSFVLGRQITNKIIIYQEALNTMRTKIGKTGYMAFKIDLEKAYDKLD